MNAPEPPAVPELWLPVPGFEGFYEASNHGRIRSIRSSGARVLKPTVHMAYGSVTLWREGRRQQSTVHSLIARTFLGPRPAGYDVCHNDGDGLNNQIDNLRYDTHRSNVMDTVRHGRNRQANQTACSRGHLLVEPNLRVARTSATSRRCLACQRGRSNVRAAARRGIALDMQERSDWHYDRIMGREVAA